MKKVSIVAVFLTLALALSGCLNDDGANYYDAPIPITAVVDSTLPDTIQPGETFSDIDFSYRIPTDCHTYLGYQAFPDTKESTDSIYVVNIVAWARVQPQDSCATIDIDKEDTIVDDLGIPSTSTPPSLFRLNFLKEEDSNGEPVFLTYDIPVKKEE